MLFFFFFQAEDGIRDYKVTGVQTCALPISRVALEEMTASARLMVDRMDTTHLSARERAAFREHLEQLSNSVTLARRAETYLRYYAGGVAAGVFLVRPVAGVRAGRGGRPPVAPPPPPALAARGRAR